LQGGHHIAVEHQLQLLHHDLWVALHVPLDPVQHQSHEQIFIERGDEFLVLLPHGHPLSFLLHHTLQQVIGDPVEVVFHLLPADGAIDIQDEGLVVQHRLKDLQKALLPRLVGLFPRQRPAGILLTAPLHQIVNILEVVVKGHAVDAAVLRNIIDGDLVQRLLQQQMLQRRLQRPLGDL